MATLPHLVDALTAVDYRGRSAIEHVARIAREAGHVPAGKRGGGGPRMDATAAANILIALNAADAPAETPGAVSAVRALVQMGGDDREELPEILRALAGEETFGGALEMSIEHAPAILDVGQSLFTDAQYPGTVEDNYRSILLGMSPIDFTVEISRTFARLALTASSLREPLQWEARFYWDIERVRDMDPQAREFFYRHYGTDRRVTSKFGFRTLLQVSAAIRDEEWPISAPIEGVE